MQALMLMCITAATFAEFISLRFPHLGWVKFIPDMLSGIAAVIIVLQGVRKGFTLVAAKYWLVFALATLVIICGIFTNGVGAGAILTGMRYYFRPMPLFLLPALVRFTDAQLQRQLKLMLLFGFVQIPFAIFQRYVVLSEGRYTGDEVIGTLVESGVLSMTMICIVLVITGFFLHKRFPRYSFVLSFLALLVPTMIDETKATVLLLPVGLLTAAVVAAPAKKRLRIVGMGVALLAAFGAILIPVYDAMEEHNPWQNEKHLTDFFTNEKNFNNYMNAGKGAGLGATVGVRRGDAVRIPLDYMSRDPVLLAFGLGIGNVAHSSLGENYTGDYFKLFEKIAVTSFAQFLLEIGLLGTAAVFLLYWFVFADSVAVARQDNTEVGALAAGWTGVVLVMTLGTFYISTHLFASLSYLYWYFSGTIAARRSELALAASTAKASASVTRLRDQTQSPATRAQAPAAPSRRA